MIGVSYIDESFLKQIKSYLLDKKDDFVQGYYRHHRSVSLVFHIVPEHIHLKPYIKDIVEGYFKDILKENISEDELRNLKFVNSVFRENEIIIELTK